VLRLDRHLEIDRKRRCFPPSRPHPHVHLPQNPFETSPQQVLRSSAPGLLYTRETSERKRKAKALVADQPLVLFLPRLLWLLGTDLSQRPLTPRNEMRPHSRSTECSARNLVPSRGHERYRNQRRARLPFCRLQVPSYNRQTTLISTRDQAPDKDREAPSEVIDDIPSLRLLSKPIRQVPWLDRYPALQRPVTYAMAALYLIKRINRDDP
jgi:hypothetical protein